MKTKFPINAFRDISTPFFYYDLDLLNTILSEVQQQARQLGYQLHYALKANINDPVLISIRKKGFGADCVSGNEILKAVETGFDPKSIVFAGVGKSDDEIRIGLQHHIHSFNCESLQELEVINHLAGGMNTQAAVSLRLNPNIDAHTHRYITTGIEENKFGINLWELNQVLEKINSFNNLTLIGLHFHIGSQILDQSVFKGLCLRINEIQQWFEERKIRINHINVGGGLGVNYSDPDGNLPDFNTYFNIFKQFLELRPGQQLHFEPGRALVAQSGSLISRVLYIKEGIKTRFAILDAGMTELIRPALYQAVHKIQNLTSSGLPLTYDVVGPICESSDCFGKAVILPQTQRGDLIAIRSTGAYGEVMSSSYNLRTKAKAYYSKDLLNHE
ncbi:MAG: diaminopimelate decarboxylase [Bacteroidales bacterium]|nr:diaminopimelate decarboxylase [Bacteroidales bacterium]